MLGPNQFVSSKQLFEADWLRARKEGVTATQVAKASTPAGFEQAVRDWFEDFVELDNPYMAFGRDMEPVLAKFVHERYGILPNDWLLANADTPWHLATPDGLSLDHTVIAEIKTTGKEWNSIPLQYRRQMQWQLHVTGAEKCLFVWMLRIDVEGVYAPAWFEPETVWVYRDEDMIDELKDTAGKLWERIHLG